MIGLFVRLFICFIVVFKTVNFICWAKQTDHKVNKKVNMEGFQTFEYRVGWRFSIALETPRP